MSLPICSQFNRLLFKSSSGRPACTKGTTERNVSQSIASAAAHTRLTGRSCLDTHSKANETSKLALSVCSTHRMRSVLSCKRNESCVHFRTALSLTYLHDPGSQAYRIRSPTQFTTRLNCPHYLPYVAAYPGATVWTNY